MFAITQEPIDQRIVEAAVRSQADGAAVTFLGIVRERADDGRAVNGLAYEAHAEMAVAEFERIAEEVRQKFGRELRVAIVHRVGDLAIGEIAVAVSVGSPHRAEAFDACRYAIDELKERAPIWKKEFYIDGDAAWKSNERC